MRVKGIGPAGVAGIVVLWLAGPALALDGPRATFELDDGFVTIRVTRDGTAPLPATLVVTLPDGTRFASGETDASGLCLLPAPSAPWCRIEFDIGGTPTPPIVLTFLDNGAAVVPLVAPLVPGPCCQPRGTGAAEGPSETADPHPTGLGMWAGALTGGVALFLVLGLFVLWRVWVQRPVPEDAR